jgi:uncharacterized protein YmfQ (DUF2313 family)
MPVIQPSAEAYARMLKSLLPPGIWRTDADSNMGKLLLACGDELARISVRAAALLEEADPRTASELLPDYERELDLSADGTDAERRARIVAHRTLRQGYRPADFREVLAPLLGQAADDVVVIERGRAFAVAVDDAQEIYRFFIFRDHSLAGTYYLDSAQGVVDAMKPAHTKGHVIESIDAECDDEFSLCDRDLIGEVGAAGGAVGYAVRKSALAAFRGAVGMSPSVLFLGHEADAVHNKYVSASGAAAASTPTGVSEAFGTDAYDFDVSGGAVWSCDDLSLCSVPAAESRAFFMIVRPRATPVNGAYAGKQAGTSEGWNILNNLLVPQVTVRNEALASTITMNLTATSAVQDAWRCICVVFDREDTELRFGSDLEAATPVALTAGRYGAPDEPLRLGDSRTPPSTVNSTDCEIALFAEVQDSAASIDPQTAAAALLAAFVA